MGCVLCTRRSTNTVGQKLKDAMRKICLHVVITAWALKAQREQVDYFVAMGMGAYFLRFLFAAGGVAKVQRKLGACLQQQLLVGMLLINFDVKEL